MPSIYQTKDPGSIPEQATIRKLSTEEKVEVEVGVGSETESEVRRMVGREDKQRRLD